MKTIFKIIIISLIFTFNSYAYDLEVNGFYYDLVSLADMTCSFSSNGSGCYEGEISIPESITYQGRTFDVIGISERAFSECTKLTKVNIPSTILTIGYCSFSGCYSLSRIDIPESVKRIENGAFFNCKALVEVKLPENLTYLGESCFSGCTSLREIEIPKTINYLHAYIFRDCEFDEFHIYNEIEYVGAGAFENAKINKLIFEDGEKTINISFNKLERGEFKRGAFLNSKIKYIYFGRPIKFYYNDVYYDTTVERNERFSPFINLDDLQEIVIGSKVDKLPINTFVSPKFRDNEKQEPMFDCYEPLPNLRSVTFLPANEQDFFHFNTGQWRKHGITELGADFKNITELKLGRKIIVDFQPERGYDALPITHLKDITISGHFNDFIPEIRWSFENIENITSEYTIPPVITGWNFTDSQKIKINIFVPGNSLEDYKTAPFWKDFWNIQAIPDDENGITSIGADEKIKVIYSINGEVLKQDCLKEDFDQFSHGIYLIVTENNKKLKVIK